MTHQLVVSLSISHSILLSCYFTDLYIVTLPEEGGAAATVEAAVPPSNYNENENSEEGAGENFVSIFPSFYYATMV